MNLISISIQRPVAVIAAVLMAILFGIVALNTIPIQLAPDVSRPVITIRTNWFGAAPEEVEREIINEQEDVLKGLKGLKSMTSQAQNGRGNITLEFEVGQNMSEALLLTANRLDRVTSYPDEADEPTFKTAGSEDNAIAWFRVIRQEGNEQPIGQYRDYLIDVVQERLERIAGVGDVNVYGGGEREMRVEVDPVLMSQHKLTVSQIVTNLRNANASITGGTVKEGKRRYIVRTDNEFDNLQKVKDVLLRTELDPVSGRMARIKVSDIANVYFSYKEPTSNIRSSGVNALAVSITRETGENVIEIMADIKAAVQQLNKGVLADQSLMMEQLYDETVYINSAIDLVIQNIWVGGVLAAVILLLFLRSARATLVVGLAIPVSVIASFVAMAFMGRSLNVVSLAGIAFAVGMVVDAAIVVLENIYRLRQQGLSVADAAYKGAQEVWGAIFVSALTTVMVFIPILVMELEVGQLFRDIAVAISISVLLSLVVSVTVIPALANRLLRHDISNPDRKIIHLPGIDHFGRAFMRVVAWMAQIVVKRRSVALAVVLVVTGISAGTTYLLMPKLEYLPAGNRNFVFGMLFPPSGYNLDTMNDIATRVEDKVKPLWVSETGPEEIEGEPPKISNFFFVALNSRTFMGARAQDEQRAGELVPVLNGAIRGEPGMFGFFNQPSIFGRGIGGTRSVDLDISGPGLEDVVTVAQNAARLVGQSFPRREGNQMRPIPGLELGEPEIRLIPDATKLADNGVSARELGLTVDVFNDGLRVDEITVDGALIDLTLRSPESYNTATQDIGALPIVTQSGLILPAASLADIHITSGPTNIQHKERSRTITLQIKPRTDIPLEVALEILEKDVVAVLKQQGLPAGIEVKLSGTAEKLTETWNEMKLNLAIALIIVYLVMAVLFESFLYPLVIMFSVPLATAGGLIGFHLLTIYKFQSFNMLTLLGFVILIGIVVNNAILIVYQTLHRLKQGEISVSDSIVESTLNRVRPIFMSTLTSVFGMIPLVLFPGAGSEIYAGLGSVVVGGLALSAILTLTIVPPLLSLVLKRPVEKVE